MADSPPLSAELVWAGDLRFDAASGSVSLPVDGQSTAGMSPMQLLAVALAGCMSIDIVDIIRKGRHPLTAFSSTVTAERAPEPPRRFLKVHLTFRVSGDVPEAAVTRALELSQDKYCSVWHSLRHDIALTASIDRQA